MSTSANLAIEKGSELYTFMTRILGVTDMNSLMEGPVSQDQVKAATDKVLKTLGRNNLPLQPGGSQFKDLSMHAYDLTSFSDQEDFARFLHRNFLGALTKLKEIYVPAVGSSTETPEGSTEETPASQVAQPVFVNPAIIQELHEDFTSQKEKLQKFEGALKSTFNAVALDVKTLHRNLPRYGSPESKEKINKIVSSFESGIHQGLDGSLGFLTEFYEAAPRGGSAIARTLEQSPLLKDLIKNSAINKLLSIQRNLLDGKEIGSHKDQHDKDRERNTKEKEETQDKIKELTEKLRDVSSSSAGDPEKTKNTVHELRLKIVNLTKHMETLTSFSTVYEKVNQITQEIEDLASGKMQPNQSGWASYLAPGITDLHKHISSYVSEYTPPVIDSAYHASTGKEEDPRNVSSLSYNKRDDKGDIIEKVSVPVKRAPLDAPLYKKTISDVIKHPFGEDPEGYLLTAETSEVIAALKKLYSSTVSVVRFFVSLVDKALTEDKEVPAAKSNIIKERSTLMEMGDPTYTHNRLDVVKIPSIYRSMTEEQIRNAPPPSVAEKTAEIKAKVDKRISAIFGQQVAVKSKALQDIGSEWANMDPEKNPMNLLRKDLLEIHDTLSSIDDSKFTEINEATKLFVETSQPLVDSIKQHESLLTDAYSRFKKTFDKGVHINMPVDSDIVSCTAQLADPKITPEEKEKVQKKLETAQKKKGDASAALNLVMSFFDTAVTKNVNFTHDREKFLTIVSVIDTLMDSLPDIKKAAYPETLTRLDPNGFFFNKSNELVVSNLVTEANSSLEEIREILHALSEDSFSLYDAMNTFVKTFPQLPVPDELQRALTLCMRIPSYRAILTGVSSAPTTFDMRHKQASIENVLDNVHKLVDGLSKTTLPAVEELIKSPAHESLKKFKEVAADAKSGTLYTSVDSGLFSFVNANVEPGVLTSYITNYIAFAGSMKQLAKARELSDKILNAVSQSVRSKLNIKKPVTIKLASDSLRDAAENLLSGDVTQVIGLLRKYARDPWSAVKVDTQKKTESVAKSEIDSLFTGSKTFFADVTSISEDLKAIVRKFSTSESLDTDMLETILTQLESTLQKLNASGSDYLRKTVGRAVATAVSKIDETLTNSDDSYSGDNDENEAVWSLQKNQNVQGFFDAVIAIDEAVKICIDGIVSKASTKAGISPAKRKEDNLAVAYNTLTRWLEHTQKNSDGDYFIPEKSFGSSISETNTLLGSLGAIATLVDRKEADKRVERIPKEMLKSLALHINRDAFQESTAKAGDPSSTLSFAETASRLSAELKKQISAGTRKEGDDIVLGKHLIPSFLKILERSKNEFIPDGSFDPDTLEDSSVDLSRKRDQGKNLSSDSKKEDLFARAKLVELDSEHLKKYSALLKSTPDLSGLITDIRNTLNVHNEDPEEETLNRGFANMNTIHSEMTTRNVRVTLHEMAREAFHNGENDVGESLSKIADHDANLKGILDRYLNLTKKSPDAHSTEGKVLGSLTHILESWPDHSIARVVSQVQELGSSNSPYKWTASDILKKALLDYAHGGYASVKAAISSEAVSNPEAMQDEVAEILSDTLNSKALKEGAIESLKSNVDASSDEDLLKNIDGLKNQVSHAAKELNSLVPAEGNTLAHHIAKAALVQRAYRPKDALHKEDESLEDSIKRLISKETGFEKVSVPEVKEAMKSLAARIGSDQYTRTATFVNGPKFGEVSADHSDLRPVASLGASPSVTAPGNMVEVNGHEQLARILKQAPAAATPSVSKSSYGDTLENHVEEYKKGLEHSSAKINSIVKNLESLSLRHRSGEKSSELDKEIEETSKAYQKALKELNEHRSKFSMNVQRSAKTLGGTTSNSSGPEKDKYQGSLALKEYADKLLQKVMKRRKERSNLVKDNASGQHNDLIEGLTTKIDKDLSRLHVYHGNAKAGIAGSSKELAFEAMNHYHSEAQNVKDRAAAATRYMLQRVKDPAHAEEIRKQYGLDENPDVASMVLDSDNLLGKAQELHQSLNYHGQLSLKGGPVAHDESHERYFGSGAGNTDYRMPGANFQDDGSVKASLSGRPRKKEQAISTSINGGDSRYVNEEAMEFLHNWINYVKEKGASAFSGDDGALEKFVEIAMDKFLVKIRSSFSADRIEGTDVEGVHYKGVLEELEEKKKYWEKFVEGLENQMKSMGASFRPLLEDLGTIVRDNKTAAKEFSDNIQNYYDKHDALSQRQKFEDNARAHGLTLDENGSVLSSQEESYANNTREGVQALTNLHSLDNQEYSDVLVTLKKKLQDMRSNKIKGTIHFTDIEKSILGPQLVDDLNSSTGALSAQYILKEHKDLLSNPDEVAEDLIGKINSLVRDPKSIDSITFSDYDYELMGNSLARKIKSVKAGKLTSPRAKLGDFDNTIKRHASTLKGQSLYRTISSRSAGKPLNTMEYLIQQMEELEGSHTVALQNIDEQYDQNLISLEVYKKDTDKENASFAEEHAELVEKIQQNMSDFRKSADDLGARKHIEEISSFDGSAEDVDRVRRAVDSIRRTRGVTLGAADISKMKKLEDYLFELSKLNESEHNASGLTSFTKIAEQKKALSRTIAKTIASLKEAGYPAAHDLNDISRYHALQGLHNRDKEDFLYVAKMSTRGITYAIETEDIKLSTKLKNISHFQGGITDPNPRSGTTHSVPKDMPRIREAVLNGIRGDAIALGKASKAIRNHVHSQDDIDTFAEVLGKFDSYYMKFLSDYMNGTITRVYEEAKRLSSSPLLKISTLASIADSVIKNPKKADKGLIDKLVLAKKEGVPPEVETKLEKAKEKAYSALASQYQEELKDIASGKKTVNEVLKGGTIANLSDLLTNNDISTGNNKSAESSLKDSLDSLKNLASKASITRMDTVLKSYTALQDGNKKAEEEGKQPPAPFTSEEFNTVTKNLQYLLQDKGIQDSKDVTILNMRDDAEKAYNRLMTISKSGVSQKMDAITNQFLGMVDSLTSDEDRFHEVKVEANSLARKVKDILLVINSLDDMSSIPVPENLVACLSMLGGGEDYAIYTNPASAMGRVYDILHGSMKSNGIVNAGMQATLNNLAKDLLPSKAKGIGPRVDLFITAMTENPERAAKLEIPRGLLSNLAKILGEKAPGASASLKEVLVAMKEGARMLLLNKTPELELDWRYAFGSLVELLSEAVGGASGSKDTLSNKWNYFSKSITEDPSRLSTVKVPEKLRPILEKVLPAAEVPSTGASVEEFLKSFGKAVLAVTGGTVKKASGSDDAGGYYDKQNFLLQEAQRSFPGAPKAEADSLNGKSSKGYRGRDVDSHRKALKSLINGYNSLFRGPAKGHSLEDKESRVDHTFTPPSVLEDVMVDTKNALTSFRESTRVRKGHSHEFDALASQYHAARIHEDKVHSNGGTLSGQQKTMLDSVKNRWNKAKEDFEDGLRLTNASLNFELKKKTPSHATITMLRDRQGRLSENLTKHKKLSEEGPSFKGDEAHELLKDLQVSSLKLDKYMEKTFELLGKEGTGYVGGRKIPVKDALNHLMDMDKCFSDMKAKMRNAIDLAKKQIDNLEDQINGWKEHLSTAKSNGGMGLDPIQEKQWTTLFLGQVMHWVTWVWERNKHIFESVFDARPQDYTKFLEMHQSKLGVFNNPRVSKAVGFVSETLENPNLASNKHRTEAQKKQVHELLAERKRLFLYKYSLTHMYSLLDAVKSVIGKHNITGISDINSVEEELKHMEHEAAGVVADFIQDSSEVASAMSVAGMAPTSTPVVKNASIIDKAIKLFRR